MVYQQHCGGENLIVFEGMAEPGSKFCNLFFVMFLGGGREG